MIVERVEISNILSHRHTIVEFPRGVTAIVGPNGAGKTSIVDAITYALFGSHSRDPHGKRAALIRLGESYATVTLDFSVRGRSYRIKKRIQRNGTTTASLYALEGGSQKLLANSAKAVEAQLRSILGLSLDLAYKLYVTRQGEIEDLLTDRKKRLDLLNSLLRIKDIENTYKEMGYLIRSFEKDKKNVEERLREQETQLAMLREKARQLERLERQLKEIVPRIEEARRRLEEAEKRRRRCLELEKHKESLSARLQNISDVARLVEKQLSEKRKELEEAKQAAQRLEELKGKLLLRDKLKEAATVKQSLLSLNERIEEYVQEAEEIKEKLERLPELERAAKEYLETEDLVERLEKAARDYEAAKARMDRLEREVSELERTTRELERRLLSRIRSNVSIGDYGDPVKALERLQGIIDEVSTLIDKIQARVSETSKAIGAKRQEIAEIGENLEKLTSARGRCPLCGRPLDEEHRLQLITQLRRRKKKAEEELAMLESKLMHLQSQLADLKKKKTMLERLARSIQGDVEKYRVYRERLERLREELSEERATFLATLAAYKEYENAKERVENLKPLYREYLETKPLADRLSAIREQLRALKEEKKRLEEELNNLLVSLGIPVERLEEALEEAELAAEEAAELRAQAAKLGALEGEVRALEEKLSSLRSEQRALAEELERVEEELAKLSGVEEEYRRLEEEYRRLSEEAASLKGKVEAIRGELERLPAVEREVARLRGEAEKLEKLMSLLNKIRQVFRDALPRLVRAKARSAIEYYLRDALYKFNMDFVDVMLGDDYEVVVVGREGKKTVNMLSGGERVAVAIAYRLAIAKAAGGRVESMIMDEPTVHLDEERRRELIGIIRYGLEATGLAQLIVITHDRELEEAADTIVEVEKRDGVSVVKVRQPAITGV